MNKNNESHPMKVAIILISESSLPIARTLSNEFPDSEIITPTAHTFLFTKNLWLCLFIATMPLFS